MLNDKNRTATFCLIALLCLAGLFLSTEAALSAEVRAALLDLWYECGGEEWEYNTDAEPFGRTNAGTWGPDQGDPCEEEWWGVFCNPSNTTVEILYPNSRFSGNPLKGTLPESFGDLAGLKQAYLSNDRTPSRLEGNVPESIGKLTDLRCLYLAHNKMNGSLPASMAHLTNLQGLFLRLNRFSGTLPDLRNLTDMRHLNIDFNAFEGGIDWVSEMKYLHTLQLRVNRFTGTLPGLTCYVHHCNAWDNNWACPLPVNGTTGHDCCRAYVCEANATANAMAEEELEPLFAPFRYYEEPPTPYLCNAP